jgi:AraC family transcriptional regulator
MVNYSASLSFIKFGFEIHRISATAGTTEVLSCPFHRLLIHRGAPVFSRGECGDVRQERLQTDGDIDVIPTGLTGIWHDENDCELWRVRLSPTLLNATAKDAGYRFQGLEPTLNVRDPALVIIVSALEGALQPHDGLDALYVESLATALATRVISLGRPPLTSERVSIFSIRERMRLVDFVMANLGGDLSLSRAAGLMLVSVSQFTKQFRYTFGMSFHQFVIRCRVERAAIMLQSTTLAASEIAYACGFAHQSHMASSMRNIMGITPGKVVRQK